MAYGTIKLTVAILIAGAALPGCRSQGWWNPFSHEGPSATDNATAGSPATAPTETAPAPRELRPAGSIESSVLIVNGETIPASEVLRRIRPELARLAATFGRSQYQAKAQDAVFRLIRDLIAEVLLYQEYAAKITSENTPNVDKAVTKALESQVLREAGGSVVKMEEILARQGSTLDELRRQIKRELLADECLKDRVRPKVIVGREDLWEYYQAHRADFHTPARVHFLLIEVEYEAFLKAQTRWSTATEDERRLAQALAEAQMKKVTDGLAQGEDFRDLAARYATSSVRTIKGDLGWMTRGSFRLKEIEDLACSLQPGQVSPPTPLGKAIYLV